MSRVVGDQAARDLLDGINRDRWRDPDVVEDMARELGWTDPGEPAALALVASSCRGRRVLDVGIGTGRTTAYLRLLTDDYVGIDYTPAMLDAARMHHPDRDLRIGDARDLSEWPDGHFALVMFSFNGLDAIDHDGRQRALAEFARVLAPDGFCVYSTLNKLGPSYDEPPWRFFGRLNAGRPRWLRVVKTLVLLPRRLGELKRTYGGWLRQRRRAVDRGAWALNPLAVYDYRFLVHFTTLDGAFAEIRAVGLEPVAAFGNDGRAYEPGGDTSGPDFFHLVARPAGPS